MLKRSRSRRGAVSSLTTRFFGTIAREGTARVPQPVLFKRVPSLGFQRMWHSREFLPYRSRMLAELSWIERFATRGVLHGITAVAELKLLLASRVLRGR